MEAIRNMWHPIIIDVLTQLGFVCVIELRFAAAFTRDWPNNTIWNSFYKDEKRNATVDI